MTPIDDEPPAPARVKGDPSGKIDIVPVLETSGRIALGSDIAVDSSNLYWASEGVGVFSLPKDGNAAPSLVVPLKDLHVTAIAASASHLAFATGDGSIHVRAATGEVRELAAHLPMPLAITVDHAHVYFTTMGSGVVQPGIQRIRLSSTGAAVVEDVQLGVAGATHLVVDAVHVYTFAARSTGRSDVIRVAKKNGAVEILAKAQENPVGIAVDDEFVYYAISGPLEMPSSRPCPKATPCPIATSAPIVKHGQILRISKTGIDQVPAAIATEVPAPKLEGVNERLVVFKQGTGIYTLPKNGNRNTAPVKLIDWSTSAPTNQVFEGITYVQRENKIYAITRRN